MHKSRSGYLAVAFATCDHKKQRIPLQTDSCCTKPEFYFEYKGAYQPKTKKCSENCIQTSTIRLYHKVSMDHGTNQQALLTIWSVAYFEQH